MKKYLIFSGPESSGKTSTATSLSHGFPFPLVAEYAREHLEEKEGGYGYEDLEIIAREQHKRMLEANNFEDDLIFVDTWLLVMEVWAQYKFGKVPAFIPNTIEEFVEQVHILLFVPDIPWKKDPLRENPGDRKVLFSMYLDLIDKYALDFSIIGGEGRVGQAEDELLKLSMGDGFYL